jgi:hypothetical protein
MRQRPAAFSAIMLAAALMVGGCTVAGALLSKTTAGKIKAKYAFPNRLTLILAESYGNSGGIEVDAGRLEANLIKEFKDNDIAPTIDPQAIERLRDADSEAYNKMTIDALGRQLGAKQVLYVHIIRAQVEIPTGSGAIHGVMDSRVHVVDSATGETLWPVDDRDGTLMETSTPWVQNTPQNQDQCRQDMANLMADGISKLFYDWDPGNETKYDEATQMQQQ